MGKRSDIIPLFQHQAEAGHPMAGLNVLHVLQTAGLTGETLSWLQALDSERYPEALTHGLTLLKQEERADEAAEWVQQAATEGHRIVWHLIAEEHTRAEQYSLHTSEQRNSGTPTR